MRNTEPEDLLISYAVRHLLDMIQTRLATAYDVDKEEIKFKRSEYSLEDYTSISTQFRSKSGCDYYVVLYVRSRANWVTYKTRVTIFSKHSGIKPIVEEYFDEISKTIIFVRDQYNRIEYGNNCCCAGHTEKLNYCPNCGKKL